MIELKDAREFIRVHNLLPSHPKVEGLSDAAFRLLMESWCYCSAHRTDGLIKGEIWKRRGTVKARKELAAAGLTIDFAGDVMMHDYTKHQLSQAEFDLIEQSKSSKGQRAAHIKWHVNRSIVEPSCPLCPKDASGITEALPTAFPKQCPDDAATNAPGCQEEEEEVEVNTPAPAARKSVLPKNLEAPFEAFWVAYPRKVGKLEAQRRFAQVVRNGHAAQEIVTGAVRYAKEARGRDAQFIAHPSTWLNQGRWADETNPAVAATSPPMGGW